MVFPSWCRPGLATLPHSDELACWETGGPLSFTPVTSPLPKPGNTNLPYQEEAHFMWLLWLAGLASGQKRNSSHLNHQPVLYHRPFVPSAISASGHLLASVSGLRLPLPYLCLLFPDPRPHNPPSINTHGLLQSLQTRSAWAMFRIRVLAQLPNNCHTLDCKKDNNNA